MPILGTDKGEDLGRTEEGNDPMLETAIKAYWDKLAPALMRGTTSPDDHEEAVTDAIAVYERTKWKPIIDIIQLHGRTVLVTQQGTKFCATAHYSGRALRHAHSGDIICFTATHYQELPSTI